MRIRTKIRCLFLLAQVLLCFVLADGVTARQVNAPADAPEAPTKAATAAMKRTAKDAWVPPDIDAVRPVTEKATCALQDVVSKAGKRVEEFIYNLNRLASTETIQTQTVSRSNTLHNPETQRFEYVVSARQLGNGNAYFEEYRGRSMNTVPQPSSDHVSVSGAFSPLLIFHPYHAKDFQMSCEGLGTWHGEPAWQIRFQEQSNHMHALIINEREYLLTLRGRAWILSDSYQVGRIETDLVNTIPEIHLRLQHEVVEYSPHNFPGKNIVMWVPSRAELYMDFRGHRFYRRHSYTDLQLFSVKIRQEYGQIR
jgi:hypothetical protein